MGADSQDLWPVHIQHKGGLTHGVCGLWYYTEPESQVHGYTTDPESMKHINRSQVLRFHRDGHLEFRNEVMLGWRKFRPHTRA